MDKSRKQNFLTYPPLLPDGTLYLVRLYDEEEAKYILVLLTARGR